MEGSHPNGVAIRKRADFDMDVVIHRNARQSVIDWFLELLHERVRLMDVGGRSVLEFGELVSIVVTAATA